MRTRWMVFMRNPDGHSPVVAIPGVLADMRTRIAWSNENDPKKAELIRKIKEDGYSERRDATHTWSVRRPSPG